MNIQEGDKVVNKRVLSRKRYNGFFFVRHISEERSVACLSPIGVRGPSKSVDRWVFVSIKTLNSCYQKVNK